MQISADDLSTERAVGKHSHKQETRRSVTLGENWKQLVMAKSEERINLTLEKCKKKRPLKVHVVGKKVVFYPVGGFSLLPH